MDITTDCALHVQVPVANGRNHRRSSPTSTNILTFSLRVILNIESSNVARAASHVTNFTDILSALAQQLSDHLSEVSKKLRLDYKLKHSTAKRDSLKSTLICSVEGTSEKRLKRLKDDITSGHLSKLIKQYSGISEDNRSWQLSISLSENSAQDAVVAAGELVCDGTAAINAGPRSGEKNSPKLQIFCKMLQDMITDKKYTQYDFLKALKNNKGSAYRLSTDLILEDDIPLLHACIEHGRLQFIVPLLLLGWFTPLSRMKVPHSSSSALAGKTALEVAEFKKVRKAVDEMKSHQSWEESLSSVMKATRSGDVTRVSRLMSVEGEMLHYRDENNGNALFWAVVNGSKEIFELLLGQLDPTMRTRKNETLLHIAATMGHSQLVEILIKRCKVDPWFEDCTRKTALDRVAENGDIEMLEAFIKCSIHPKPSFVVIAANNGRRALVEHALNILRMPIESRDIYKRTPILRAVEAGREEMVQFLNSSGADLSVVSSTGRNILHMAAECGDVTLLERIIAQLSKLNLLKAMMNARDKFNGVECCFLIRGRDKGRDAWHYVEVKRHLVPLFLKRTKCGNVDVAMFGSVLTSGWGLNPEQETIDYVENIFKERRLKQDAAQDQTPLHLAIFKGNTEVAAMLLRHGADVNVKDSFGLTPLMAASARNQTELVKMLEERGANLKEVSKDGKTALQIAEENSHDEIVNYFKGRDYTAQIENFLKSDVTRLMNELAVSRLDRLRGQGFDVKKHIVDTLRDFRIDINPDTFRFRKWSYSGRICSLVIPWIRLNQRPKKTTWDNCPVRAN